VSELTVDALLDPAGGPAELAEAARAGPTAIDATTGALWVLGYDEIEHLAHDQRMVGVGLTFFDLMGIEGELRRWYGSLMFTNEGEAHLRLRRLVSRAFTPRSAEQLRGEAAQRVDDVFEQLAADGEGDLAEVFSRLAMRVMCRLLGVPDEDVEVFGSWADALSPVFGFMTPDEIEAAATALRHLLAYVADLVERRDGDPADDLVSALLLAEHEGDRLARDEVVTMIANLIVGGHDTTTSQLGCTLLTLLRHPEAVEALRAGTAQVPEAVSETMRYEPSLGIVPRTAGADIDIGGVTRPAGTMVLLSLFTGNRDPAVWERGDSFDVHRFALPSTPRLLSFGSGPHYCLGANLARMTLEETVAAFAARTVEPMEDLEHVAWRRVLGRSPVRLPVRVA